MLWSTARGCVVAASAPMPGTAFTVVQNDFQWYRTTLGYCSDSVWICLVRRLNRWGR